MKRPKAVALDILETVFALHPAGHAAADVQGENMVEVAEALRSLPA